MELLKLSRQTLEGAEGMRSDYLPNRIDPQLKRTNTEHIVII